MNLVVRNAENRPEENAALLKLMRSSPMKGMIQLSLERQPNIFESLKLSGYKTLFKVVEDTDASLIVGCIGFAYRNLYINGKPEEVVFASDVRVDPRYRGKGIMRLVIDGFRQEMGDKWAQGMVLKGNAKAEKILMDNIPDFMPKPYAYGEMETNLVFARKQAKFVSDATLRNATAADIPAMQALYDSLAPQYQFSPQYDFAALDQGDSYYMGLKISDFILAERAGKLVAFAGLWNQKAHKQTRIVKYETKLKTVRVVYNAYNRLTGKFTLPKEGEYLNYLYMNSITCADSDMDVLRDIVAFAIQRAYTQDMVGVSVSLSPTDPRIKALSHFSKNGVTGRHFLTGFCDDPRQQFESLDSRPLAVEVCRL